jgi:hypothetical protein
MQIGFRGEGSRVLMHRWNGRGQWMLFLEMAGSSLFSPFLTWGSPQFWRVRKHYLRLPVSDGGDKYGLADLLKSGVVAWAQLD